LARETVSGCQSAYPRTRVDIGELPGAYGDPTMLRQVLQNLVSNAFKFSSKSAEPRIAIGAQQQQERTVYFVADNGVGFNMRDADKLFGVFQRLHAEQEFSGTGAGLAIVKRLIERHDGTIWVESTPNAGATFYFTLK
jgi:light-regulated signal transduction histidine kinase (bacteriophytochrome)